MLVEGGPFGGSAVEPIAAVVGPAGGDVTPQRWCCDVAWVGDDPCWWCGSEGTRWEDLPPDARPPAWATSFSGRFECDELPVGPWTYRFEQPA